jgi:hypothetical protein
MDLPLGSCSKPSRPEKSADSTNFQYMAGSILPIYPTAMTTTAAQQPRAGVLRYSRRVANVRQARGQADGFWAFSGSRAKRVKVVDFRHFLFEAASPTYELELPTP